jgi:transcriptional regulator with XRE-family HTH domain
MSKEVRSKLKEARLKRGWTQAYLAEITGYSRIYIILLEKGRVPRPSLKACKKISYALGIQPEDVAGM